MVEVTCAWCLKVGLNLRKGSSAVSDGGAGAREFVLKRD